METVTQPESALELQVRRLRISSADAVENAHTFTEFKQYFHVERPIQLKVEELLEKYHEKEEPRLILLCGSVGDGKSHLLAYLNHQRNDLLKDYQTVNDATESASPTQTALETLENTFKYFSDEHWGEVNKKIIIAINLGILHEFVNQEQKKYSFERLKNIVRNSKLFNQEIVTDYEEEVVSIISFSDYQVFDLSAKGVDSRYLKELLQKVCSNEPNNPFYQAYEEDKLNGNTNTLHENYCFLCDEDVRHQMVQYLIRLMVQYKVVLSTRHFLNFIADILLPISEQTNQLQSFLPSRLFNNKGQSSLLDEMSKLHPIHARTPEMDQMLVSLNTLSDWDEIINEDISNELAKKWIKDLKESENTEEEIIRFLLETLALTHKRFAHKIEPKTYRQYIHYLYGFNVLNRSIIRDFDDKFQQAIYHWKGTPQKDYIFLDYLSDDITLAQELKLRRHTNHLTKRNENMLHSFFTYLPVKYSEEDYVGILQVDYTLFVLLQKVIEGYRPNMKDKEDAITFIEFLTHLMDLGQKEEELMVNFLTEGKTYKLEVDPDGDLLFFIFRREG